MKTHLYICLAAVMACGLPAREASPAVAPRGEKLLMAHYMPWYAARPRSRSWGAHWTMGKFNPERSLPGGLPEIASHVHPLIGLYDSNDPDVIECQLLQMKLAGISGVIVDWYGATAFADYAMIHSATKKVFDATRRTGMLFAVCYEDRTIGLMVDRGALQEDRISEHLRETMVWARDNWFGSAHYLKLQGRPVILNFGPVRVKRSAPWQAAFEGMSPRPCFLTLPHLWRKACADGHFSWLPLEPRRRRPTPAQVRRWLKDYSASAEKGPAMAMASAFPGFHDIYEEASRAKSYGFIDDREGETLRESLRIAMEGPTRVVQLVTWNDYGEGTVIEPTHEDGYRNLEIIAEAMRRKPGGKLPCNAGGLRLPGKLLRLRRQARAGSPLMKQLDEVSRMLSHGDVDRAAELLRSLGKGKRGGS